MHPAMPRTVKILGKQVLIDTVTRDTYNRAVANMKVGGKSINKAMMRYGGNQGQNTKIKECKLSAFSPARTFAD
jgi:endonuclease YncB( thermonuclease family)